MAMAERARYNARLAGVFNAEIQPSLAQSFTGEERERERGTRACLRACTNPNPSPIVRSSDRTILSVPGLERFCETARITNYWPGSKWMLNPSSWMCLLHPWENTGPFIIIRVFSGLFHFGDRDLAGQGGTTSLPEWGRVLQIVPNPPPPPMPRDSSGYQSWWAWLLNTNHLVLTLKHGYQEIECPVILWTHGYQKIKYPGILRTHGSQILLKKNSNISAQTHWVFGRFFHETWQLSEVFEIPRTSGSLNPMFFSKYLDLAVLWFWKFSNGTDNSSILNFSNAQNWRVLKTLKIPTPHY